MAKSKAAHVEEPPKGELVGYARVSTDDQKLDLQIDALTRAGVHPDRLLIEKVSGASKRRPALDLAIKQLRPGDTLVVWRLDRLARSMRDLYKRLDEISAQGASFRSLQESFDFGTATGRFVLGILGLVAELERQLTIERTRAGVRAARERGATFGAPRKMTDERLNEIRELLRKPQWTVAKIAKKYGMAPATIYTHLKGGKQAVVGKRTYVSDVRKPKSKSRK